MQQSSGGNVPWAAPWITEYWDGGIGITITGAGVSNWAPVVGTHSFTQGTDAARLTYANGTLTANGSQWMQTGAFTLNQGYTRISCVSQIAWANNKALLDGIDATHRAVLDQKNGGASPELDIYAGGFATTVSTLTIGLFGIIVEIYNGAASSLQHNLNAASTGNAGAQHAGGLTVGATYDGTGGAQCAFKGLCYASTVLTAAQITQTVQAMARRYGVSV